MRTTATVILPGCPANWSQWRGTSLARDMAKKPWRDLALMLGQSARNEARWPLPVRTVPPAARWLVIDVFKQRPLFDEDGCVSALKPIIDGLKGALLVDDSPAWCHLARLPQQHLVELERDMRVEVVVHLTRPTL